MDISRLTDAYLHRIGATRPRHADAAALRELHVRHLLSVPFENLSIHLSEEIVLEEEALVRKVVERRRGGFCYELNGAFSVLLRALGFPVVLLQARVLGPEGTVGIPYDHLALLVETVETVEGAEAGGEPGEEARTVRRWLTDVGFGDHSLYPLDLDERGDQKDPAGTFRIAETAEGDLEVLRDGTARYRVETRPRVLADFRAGAWYHRTSPDSHFSGSLVCSRRTEEGRVTLSGDRLVTTAHGERQERPLEGEKEILTAYRDHFGLRFDRVPELRQPPVGGV
ncbi:arylamine N-acetyltransferase family protein [Streptomyces lushanensis]|uniref:arylamine N-acetyltransferase family protein n=1 Tax=Streptomyces lushanensis TaxID=1434255 RepID=UPI00082ABA58|nr:arylamine N-acetyltransferase [Streptomyces lushanensis]